MDQKLGRPEGTSLALISYVTDRAGHDLRYAIDATKLKMELGWEPKVKFTEGFDATVDWYLSNEQWLQNILTGAYKNYIPKSK